MAMIVPFRIFAAWVILIALATSAVPAQAQSGQSTRIVDPKQHARRGEASYPYREKADYLFGELDLRPGDVVVDIGAGDGWWSERMAPFIGESGVIHAAEVDEAKVKEMKEKFAAVPQIKPYVCKTDRTLLEENSCDLAFFSQSYHHLDRNGHVDYLKHLHTVVKPTGRLCVIEKDATLSNRKAHGTYLGELISQAEAAGWIALRTELMPGTYHYLAIFAQRELFPPEPEENNRDTGPAAEKPIAHTDDSLEVVKERLAKGEALLLDVREQDEWDAGHLAQATLVPLSVLREKGTSKEFADELAGELPKKVLYCHCRSGGRVLAAAPILKRLGYDIRPLKAGYDDLLKAGFPKAE
jgi:rhodanese-related sulfurtransferase/ubiquinone/menaquinone biosynthesis C-methylase UbiE